MIKLEFRHIILGLALGCTFAATALDLPVRRVNGKDFYVYTVQRNESLIDVANKLNITRDDIIDSNPGAVDGVKMGQKLYLPVSEFSDSNDNASGATADGTQLRYKVGKGETLFGIAYRFGVTPDEIADLNPNVNAGVKAGDIILIPAGAKERRSTGSKELPKAANVVEARPEIAPEGTVADNGERRLRPVNPPAGPIEPAGDDNSTVEAEVVDIEAVSADTARIAVMIFVVDAIGKTS